MLKITSPLHLQTAIYQALLSESQGSLRTKTIHSEIIWALNPTNNVRIVGVPLLGQSYVAISDIRSHQVVRCIKQDYGLNPRACYNLAYMRRPTEDECN